MSYSAGFGGGSSSIMKVDSQEVGKIIGRGGCKIKELEQVCRARIKISNNVDEDGMKEVEIIGTDDVIEKTRRKIEDCLSGADFGGGRRGGYGGGRGRGGGGGGGGGYGRSRGEGGSWGRRDRDSGDGGYGRRDDYERGGFGSGGRGGGGYSEGGDSETIYVESSEVGRIIGRGGSRIKEMESDSGCRIKVFKDGGGSQGRSSVQLSGSKSSISKAKRLIEDAGVEIMNGDDRGRANAVVKEKEEPVSKVEVQPQNNWTAVRETQLECEEEWFVEVKEVMAEPVSKIQEQPPVNWKAIRESQKENNVERFGEYTQNTANKSCRVFATVTAEIKKKEEPVSKVEVINWKAIREMQKEYEKERFRALPPIIKDFYKEDPNIANMSPEEVSNIRKENNNIIVEGPGPVPNPVKTFEDAFKHYPLILGEIGKQSFVKPSPIQCQAWPILLQGKDLIGIAQTGTGKTLAFLLPALIHIDSQPVRRANRDGPSALILSPTRELAIQIEMEINKINYKGIRSICVYGGGDRKEQKAKAQKGVEIVVATPGRLNDFMMNGVIDLKYVTYLVMDEADRMLDLGFELEIKKVMLDIRPDRQTVMTSATWPPGVQKLADQYMTNPYKVFVGTLDLAAVHSVRQQVEFVDQKEKKSLLLGFIAQMQEDDKLIVFVGKKIVADDVSSDLALKGIMCQCIHGDREQCDRETALQEFKDGTVHILIATDVASRGLDVKDITHVLNYDFPNQIEEYVHRIGRTGRAGRTGTAISFLTRNDWSSARELINIMSEADQEIPNELLALANSYTAYKQRVEAEGGTVSRGGRGGRGGGGRQKKKSYDCGNGWI